MKKKIPVGILGATGSVGQMFVNLLEDHPFFEINDLCASERSHSKKYSEAVNWIIPKPLSERIGNMVVKPCEPNINSRIVFSGLDSKVAGEIESNFAKNGYIVISNSKNHRMFENVPLLIPDVNPDHLDLIKHQKYGKGLIITNPNCSTIGLCMALKPIIDEFGLDSVNVVTMQAISGAGYPGVASLDIIDNVIPFIKDEEEKMELEPLKILGKINNNKIDFAEFKISAQCNRVAVINGHTECVSIKTIKKTTKEEIISVWKKYTSIPQQLNLPFAPKKPIHYFEKENYPQPRIHRNVENGMALSIGRLRECPIFDYKFVILSHNTIRGAAGCAILNAELLITKYKNLI
ncbi:MAG TPA: aspartate-semialdehyde dehydrogenase [Bacteroidota bacterium]|nr:aspartate-semialdehyde dehydrogenase [Bacteroidota bacterium]